MIREILKDDLDGLLRLYMQLHNNPMPEKTVELLQIWDNIFQDKNHHVIVAEENGADSFWYWDVGAFVFAGDETAVSVSGKDYKVTDRTVQENDIITIDLSPQKNNIWGDYARTLVFENGILCDKTDKIKNNEWRRGLQMEEYLHKTLIDVATPDMTFEELYYLMNDVIVKKGFLNLDFLGNLGHSIVKNKNDRIYTEKGNHQRLSDVKMFTFEPHISIPDSQYGFKREDIYYFDNGKLIQL